eukprot:scaffold5679_cov58-Cylindrotheca_fusiformis.AAC.3
MTRGRLTYLTVRESDPDKGKVPAKHGLLVQRYRTGKDCEGKSRSATTRAELLMDMRFDGLSVQ